MNQYLSLSKIITTFTIEKIVKRLHDVLFLTVWNSRKIQSRVKDRATVNASYISVRFSPLPSCSTWQCEKPQTVGRRRESDPTLSFLYYDRGGVHPVWLCLKTWKLEKGSGLFLTGCRRPVLSTGLQRNWTATVEMSTGSLRKRISTYICWPASPGYSTTTSSATSPKGKKSKIFELKLL